MIIFNALFSSLILIQVNLRRSLLSDINLTAQEFGVVFGVLSLLAAVTTSKTSIVHQKYKNRTLTHLSIYYIFAVIISGLVVSIDLPLALMTTIVLVSTAIQFMIKGPYQTLMKQYLNNFSQSNMRIKIHSANLLIECITSFIFTLICSFLLTITTTSNVTIVLGIIFLLLIIISLHRMKNKVGLRPEQYKKSDINYHELL